MRLLVVGPLPPPIGGATLLFDCVAAQFQRSPQLKVQVLDSCLSRYSQVTGLRQIVAFRNLCKLAFCVPRCDVALAFLSNDNLLQFTRLMSILCGAFGKALIIRKFGMTDFYARSPNSENVDAVYVRQVRSILQRTDLYLSESQAGVRMAERDGIEARWHPNVRPMPDQPETTLERTLCRRFIFVGHVKPSKGVRELILASRGLPSDCCVDVYGPLQEGILEAEFEAQPRINYRGVADPSKVIELMRKYDALVFPTYYRGEGYPGVVLEAWAAGIPVIVSRWQDLPEMIGGKGGVLVKPQDAEALQREMLRLVHDDDLYRTLQAQAAERRSEFSASRWTEPLLEYCREALKKARVRSRKRAGSGSASTTRGSFAHRLFESSPTMAKNVFCTCEGIRLKRLRMGGAHSMFAGMMERSQWWSRGRKLEHQTERVRKVLLFCGKDVPYYRKQFARLRFRPEHFTSLDELRQLPVLEKETLRENLRELVAELPAWTRRVSLHTSGTTGTPLHLITSPRCIQAYWAASWRHRRWFGVEPGMSHATFNGRSIIPQRQTVPPFWCHNHADRQTLFSLYHMREETLTSYVRELQRVQRDYIDGYPSAVYQIARFMIEGHFHLRWRPKAVFLSSETLLDNHRAAIAQAFACPVAEFYGMAEMVASAGQCPEGNFHFDSEIGYVEVDPLVDDPSVGRLVCTTLLEGPMPLLRYNTQDIVVLSKGCCCGRAGTVAKQIDGRMEAYILTPEGNLVGRLDHVFKELDGIKESQIVQKTRASLCVSVVRAPGFKLATEQRLVAALQERVGRTMNIDIQYLERIPRSQSGKLRAVISEISQNALPETQLSESP